VDVRTPTEERGDVKTRTLLLGIVIGALLAGGLAFGVAASATTPSTTYYACLAGGSLSKVGTVKPTCTLPAKLISWNSTGPQGPPGTTAFGSKTQGATLAASQTCIIGQIYLQAGKYYEGVPANGQVMSILSNTTLFDVIGAKYGGNGSTTFALPNLNKAAPNGLTYTICTLGIFP